jgi:very-short-patch-repair endonuclease
VNRTANARRLRREQADEEKELRRVLRAGRLVGFKFRRRHPLGAYYLDFYGLAAKLSVELDGFQHGMPKQHQHDEEREKLLATQGVEELRFWNHQQRIPTRLESAVGCGFAGKTHIMVHCMDGLAQHPIQHARSASGPAPVGHRCCGSLTFVVGAVEGCVR